MACKNAVASLSAGPERENIEMGPQKLCTRWPCRAHDIFEGKLQRKRIAKVIFSNCGREAYESEIVHSAWVSLTTSANGGVEKDVDQSNQILLYFEGGGEGGGRYVSIPICGGF